MLHRVERQSVSDTGASIDPCPDGIEALGEDEHAALKRALHNVKVRRDDVSARLRAVQERRQTLQDRLIGVRRQLSAALYALYMLELRSGRHGSLSTVHDAPHHIPKSRVALLSTLSLDVPRARTARPAPCTAKMVHVDHVGQARKGEIAATAPAEPMFGRAGVVHDM